MAQAIKWAWPPIEGTWVEFDSNELLEAVSALCKLVEAQPDDAAVNNIIQHHESEEPDETDLTYLGKELKQLGALRSSLLKASGQINTSKAASILKGYDELCKA